jgi:excisionase family DNA binding protein
MTLLAPKEAAARLNVSMKTLQRLVVAGKLSYIDVGSRTRRVHRFSEENLSSFLRQQEVREVPACPSTNAPILASGGSSVKGKAKSILSVLA